MWNLMIVDDERFIAEELAKVIRHIGEEYQIMGIFGDPMEAYLN